MKLFVRRVSRVLVAVSAAALDAQEPAAAGPKVQPREIDLGQVTVGATVEASFGVFWVDAALASATANVDAPAGVEVLAVTTEKYGERALTQVQFVVRTGRDGAVDAVFTVRCRGETATVPLRAKVVAAPRGACRVLVAESPFEALAGEDAALLGAWREIVAGARLDVDYRIVRRGRPTFDVAALGRVDVVLAGESALVALDDVQVAKLQGFVCGGGRVIVCANAFYEGTVRSANRVAEAFELAIEDREPPTATTWRANGDGIVRHALTVGVDSIAVVRPSPVKVTEPQHAQVLVALDDPAALPFAAVSTTPNGGEMVVVGDSLWWNTANKSPGFARFLRNLLQRPPRPR